MNELIYILLGFFAGCIFMVLWFVSKVKGLAIKAIDLDKKQDKKDDE